MVAHSNSRRTAAAIVVLVLLLAGVAVWFGRVSSEEQESRSSGGTTSANASEQTPAGPLPGEIMFRGYGTAESAPEKDLDAVAHALGNLVLLVKGPDPFRMGANEEFAAALRGKNRAGLRFLPDDHPAFNAAGQIVDRWGSPLFFHVESVDRVDVRSAGPDGEMWTGDDLQRRHDGRFHRGEGFPKPDGGSGM